MNCPACGLPVRGGTYETVHGNFHADCYEQATHFTRQRAARKAGELRGKVTLLALADLVAAAIEAFDLLDAVTDDPPYGFPDRDALRIAHALHHALTGVGCPDRKKKAEVEPLRTHPCG